MCFARLQVWRSRVLGRALRKWALAAWIGRQQAAFAGAVSRPRRRVALRALAILLRRRAVALSLPQALARWLAAAKARTARCSALGRLCAMQEAWDRRQLLRRLLTWKAARMAHLAAATQTLYRLAERARRASARSEQNATRRAWRTWASLMDRARRRAWALRWCLSRKQARALEQIRGFAAWRRSVLETRSRLAALRRIVSGRARLTTSEALAQWRGRMRRARSVAGVLRRWARIQVLGGFAQWKHAAKAWKRTRRAVRRVIARRWVRSRECAAFKQWKSRLEHWDRAERQTRALLRRWVSWRTAAGFQRWIQFVRAGARAMLVRRTTLRAGARILASGFRQWREALRMRTREGERMRTVLCNWLRTQLRSAWREWVQHHRQCSRRLAVLRAALTRRRRRRVAAVWRRWRCQTSSHAHLLRTRRVLARWTSARTAGAWAQWLQGCATRSRLRSAGELLARHHARGRLVAVLGKWREVRAQHDLIKRVLGAVLGCSNKSRLARAVSTWQARTAVTRGMWILDAALRTWRRCRTATALHAWRRASQAIREQGQHLRGLVWRVRLVGLRSAWCHWTTRLGRASRIAHALDRLGRRWIAQRCSRAFRRWEGLVRTVAFRQRLCHRMIRRMHARREAAALGTWRDLVSRQRRSEQQQQESAMMLKQRTHLALRMLLGGGPGHGQMFVRLAWARWVAATARARTAHLRLAPPARTHRLEILCSRLVLRNILATPTRSWVSHGFDRWRMLVSVDALVSKIQDEAQADEEELQEEVEELQEDVDAAKLRLCLRGAACRYRSALTTAFHDWQLKAAAELVVREVVEALDDADLQVEQARLAFLRSTFRRFPQQEQQHAAARAFRRWWGGSLLRGVEGGVWGVPRGRQGIE